MISQILALVNIVSQKFDPGETRDVAPASIRPHHSDMVDNTPDNQTSYDLTPGLKRPAGSPALAKAYAARSRKVMRKGFGSEWPAAGRIGLNAPAPLRHRLLRPVRHVTNTAGSRSRAEM